MNVDLSVIKRRTESASTIINRLKSQGFSQTNSIMGGRLVYLENSEGIGLTVVDGPRGTVITPSGPIRGMVFGENSVGLGIVRSSSNGSSKDTSDSSSNSRGSSGDSTFNV